MLKNILLTQDNHYNKHYTDELSYYTKKHATDELFYYTNIVLNRNKKFKKPNVNNMYKKN